MSNSVVAICPRCDGTMEYAAKDGGAEVGCPHCDSPLVLPNELEEKAPEKDSAQTIMKTSLIWTAERCGMFVGQLIVALCSCGVVATILLVGPAIEVLLLFLAGVGVGLVILRVSFHSWKAVFEHYWETWWH